MARSEPRHWRLHNERENREQFFHQDRTKRQDHPTLSMTDEQREFRELLIRFGCTTRHFDRLDELTRPTYMNAFLKRGRDKNSGAYFKVAGEVARLKVLKALGHTPKDPEFPF